MKVSVVLADELPFVFGYAFGNSRAGPQRLGKDSSLRAGRFLLDLFQGAVGR